MNIWWENLLGIEKFFWFIAIPASVLFVLQTIMFLVGIGGSGFDFEGIDTAESGFGGFDGDLVPISKSLFNIRNVIYFSTVFGWTGILNIESGKGSIVSIIISLIIASGVILILTFILRFLMRAACNGIMDKKNSVGKTGQVYLKIPRKGGGAGKVNIILQGSLRELDAESDGEEIQTEEEIEVVGILDNGNLLVRKIVLLKGD